MSSFVAEDSVDSIMSNMLATQGILNFELILLFP